MEDFGIFHGAQEIPLERGLYIVHGENGRGKTTVLNAVKWAFFGAFTNRQGKQVTPEVILNRDARRDGKTTFAVTLEIDDAGTRYLVRRTCQVGPSTTVALYVERDGTPLTQAEAAHTLGNLLNEGISRFFLFDGEQLREYEELLLEDESTARVVKTSIEQILGLPVLQNAIEDLRAVADQVAKRIAKLARQNAETKQLGLQDMQLESEITDAEDDLAELEKHRTEADAVIAEADAVLQKYDYSQEVLKQIEALETEITGIEQMIVDSETQRTAALRGAWQDVLFVAVAPRRAELQSKLEAQRQAEFNRRSADQLLDSLNAGVCAVCDQPLTGQANAAVRVHLEALPQDDGQGEVDVGASLLTLAAIARSNRLNDAIERDEHVAELAARKASKTQELHTVRASVQDVPEDDVRRAGQQRDAATEQRGQIKHLIENAQDNIAKKRVTLHDVRRQIAERGDSPEIDEIRAREKLARDTADLFELAKSQYRDAMRSSVEAAATEIFKGLTTEPSHAGLRINESYGLETINAAGDVDLGRSAGQEQIVALSLIAALNRNATRRAPVMMDTPFGRLDEQHRAKVLRFLASMADQVFLFVHSGEVSEEDLKTIASDVTAEFELHRVSADQTELRPLVGT